MLSAEEFTPGTLSKAEPLTLLLPRHEHERAMLVVPGEGTPTVVMLSESDQFISFECASNTVWAGLMIPRVRIEVDETSVFLLLIVVVSHWVLWFGVERRCPS